MTDIKIDKFIELLEKIRLKEFFYHIELFSYIRQPKNFKVRFIYEIENMPLFALGDTRFVKVIKKLIMIGFLQSKR